MKESRAVATKPCDAACHLPHPFHLKFPDDSLETDRCFVTTR